MVPKDFDKTLIFAFLSGERWGNETLIFAISDPFCKNSFYLNFSSYLLLLESFQNDFM